MPDIFGKNPSDYRMIQDLAKKGFLDSHKQHLEMRGRTHNFDALPSFHNPIPRPFKDTESNAQAMTIATNNLEAMQAQIDEILYSEFRLDKFFPIITSIPEGAATYAYKVINKYGAGKFISNSGRDANDAGISMQSVPYSLSYGGIIPSWTIEDLRAAAFMGVPLDTKTIEAGTTGCLNHIEQVGLNGDLTYNFNGLINAPNIPASGSAKLISNMSADEMVAFIQENVSGIINQTQEIFSTLIKTGMTLYLPIAQEGLIGDTKLAEDASKTVWEYVKINNQWTRRTGLELKLEVVAELAGAGAGATDRALFGFNNEKIMEMAMPIQPRIVKTIETHYGVDSPMEYKISGLNVKHPGGMRYVDSI